MVDSEVTYGQSVLQHLLLRVVQSPVQFRIPILRHIHHFLRDVAEACRPIGHEPEAAESIGCRVAP